MKRVILALLLLAAPGLSQEYPATRKVEQVDTYHGVQVADPYRWLEDDNAADTLKWVEAENRVTFAYLDKIGFRPRLKERLKQLYDYPKYGIPVSSGENYVYSHNTGLQNQSVLYIQKGLDGKPEVLLDPNTLSPDGTTKLSVWDLSHDGRYLAYGLSKGGSDWQEYKVMEVATRQTLPDSVQWVKVSGLAWQGQGFYYSRYPEPVAGHELSTKNENHKVYYHKVGTPQSQDQLVYENPAHPQRFNTVSVTEDERFVILNVSDRGSGKKGNMLFYKTPAAKDFSQLVGELGDDTYSVLDNVGASFLVLTDHEAPRRQILRFDPAVGKTTTVVPTGPDTIESANTAGGKLFVNFLKDVTSRIQVYDLDGRPLKPIALPGVGNASAVSGRAGDKTLFYTFTSLNTPTSIYRYEVASGQSSLFRAPQIPGFKPDDYETRQVFYPSKDGTRVPMFLAYKKGLQLDGNNPTLLYGYGGFNVVNYPLFSPLRIALLENGVVYASANLRGGGEYGEAWHEAGTKLKKQNVFDDFIAAAEWLIANKYTNSKRLAIQGGSNGGLLVGAVLNQRPDLFQVGLPAVGVMDMLRFHKFTIGWNWIPDYGSSDDPAQFKVLYGYSPLHNLKPISYPAVLVTTADHDDRVVPAHSFKYAATLQENQKGKAPVLIRIDTKSGHGASNTAKQIEATADIYSFLLYNLGVTPR